MTYVFVYGSLLRGEPNHGVMEGARFVRAAVTCKGVALVRSGPYPSLTFVDDCGGERRAQIEASCVRGELYEVDDEHLAALDAFEGHPHLFRRLEIALEDGMPAMTYARAPAHANECPLVRKDDWRDR